MQLASSMVEAYVRWNLPRVIRSRVGRHKVVRNWRTITLGKYSSKSPPTSPESRSFNMWANRALYKIAYAESLQKVSLDLVQVAGLGFTDESVSRGEILKRAVDQGWALAPAEVGAVLAAEWHDQPPGRVQIGMEPHVINGDILCPGVERPGDQRSFFLLNADDRRMLMLVDAAPDVTYPIYAWFVFVSRAPQPS